MDRKEFIQQYILARASVLPKVDSEALVLSAIKLYEIMSLMVDEE